MLVSFIPNDITLFLKPSVKFCARCNSWIGGYLVSFCSSFTVAKSLQNWVYYISFCSRRSWNCSVAIANATTCTSVHTFYIRLKRYIHLNCLECLVVHTGSFSLVVSVRWASPNSRFVYAIITLRNAKEPACCYLPETGQWQDSTLDLCSNVSVYHDATTEQALVRRETRLKRHVSPKTHDNTRQLSYASCSLIHLHIWQWNIFESSQHINIWCSPVLSMLNIIWLSYLFDQQQERF